MKRIDKIVLKHLISAQVRSQLTAGGKMPRNTNLKPSPRLWPPLVVMPNTVARHPTLDEYDS